MKLLLLISNLGSGGAERQLVTLAVLFKEKGIDVEFVVYHKDDFFKHILDNNGIKVNKLNPKNNIDRIVTVRRFIRQSNCNGVISFLEINNFLGCVSAFGGKKWKLITNELSSKESTFLSRQGKIFGWFQRYSDTIICNSYNAKAMWANYYPEYKNKLSVIYNPINMPEITSEYVPKRNGKLHLVIAASYQYLKNPIGLIHALALLNEEEKNKIEVNWYGRIEITGGNRKPYDKASNLIKQHKLKHIIYLNEATKDIANKMHEADVVALFSELEGLPNAICEGMMLGKPIIMSRVSDYEKLVDDSNGFLCDWNNPKSIKGALMSAVKLSENELDKMGNSSRLKAHKYFSKETIINQWLELFR